MAQRRALTLHDQILGSELAATAGEEIALGELLTARLANGIELILGDAQLCQRLIANAIERAQTDFNIAASRAAFFQLLGLDGVRE